VAAAAEAAAVTSSGLGAKKAIQQLLSKCSRMRDLLLLLELLLVLLLLLLTPSQCHAPQHVACAVTHAHECQRQDANTKACIVIKQ
jgi:hypothetical protein